MLYTAGEIQALMSYRAPKSPWANFQVVHRVCGREDGVLISKAMELSSGGEKKTKTHENGSHSTSPIYHCPQRPFTRGITDRAR